MKIVIKRGSIISEGLLAEVSLESVIANKDKAIRKMAKSWVYHRQNTEAPSAGGRWGAEWGRWGLSVEDIVPALDAAIMARVPDDIEEKQKALVLMWMLRIGRTDILNTEHFVESAAQVSRILDMGLGDAMNDEQTYHDRNQIEKFFHYSQFMKVRDLNKISTMRRLLRIVHAAHEDISAYQEARAYDDADEGTEVLREDVDWKIAILHNKGAACKLGKGTDWCTAAPGLNYFKEYYRKDDPLFYFEERDEDEYQKDLKFYSDSGRSAETTPDRRYFAKIYQFHYGSKQFMDAEDRPVGEDKAMVLTSLLVRALGDRIEQYPNLADFHKTNKVKLIVQDPEASPEDLHASAKMMMTNPGMLGVDSYGGDTTSWYLMHIAKNPNVGPDTLASIVNFYYGSDVENRDDWKYVMRSVAANPKTPGEILDYMADTQDIKVRNDVAENPSTPSNTLRMLARGGDPASLVARNRVSLEENFSAKWKKYIKRIIK